MDPIISRREYNREYQRQRYNADPEKGRAYKKSMQIKKQLNVGEALWNKYKHHLADILKLTEIARRLPREFVMEIVENLPDNSADITEPNLDEPTI